MHTRFLLITGLIFLLFASCGKFSEFPGFKKGEHGIYYQLHTIGDDDTIKAKPGDFITVNLMYLTMTDSVFFSGTRKFQVFDPAYEGAIDECFSMMSVDESTTFILAADNFFTVTLHDTLPRFIKSGGNFKVRVEMLEIQSEEDYLSEKEAFLSWIDDFGDYEKVILKQFIAEEKLDVSPLPSGIFYLNINPGTGKKVEAGDTVVVNYEGRFLNGRFFDSTIKRNEPFQFVYGTEWQVIEGLEEAIGYMREGEKSIFILPSELAFGNRGSSNNIIPPFTSLIFEVEILKVSSSVVNYSGS
jgi:FKBP-type peptidyl-prolyl cis-trans isomerase FkpA